MQDHVCVCVCVYSADGYSILVLRRTDSAVALKLCCAELLFLRCPSVVRQVLFGAGEEGFRTCDSWWPPWDVGKKGKGRRRIGGPLSLGLHWLAGLLARACADCGLGFCSPLCCRNAASGSASFEKFVCASLAATIHLAQCTQYSCNVKMKMT